MSCIDHIITYSRLSITMIILSRDDGLFICLGIEEQELIISSENILGVDAPFAAYVLSMLVLLYFLYVYS